MALAAASVSMMAAPIQPAFSQKIEKGTVSAPAVTKEITGLVNGFRTRASEGPVLNNYMAYTYYGRTQEDSGENYCSVELKQISSTEVMIYGLFFNFGVKATYDPTEQTLTVRGGQEVIPAAEFNGVESCNCYIFKLDPETGAETMVNTLTFYYAPDGVEFTDGSVDYIGGWMPESPYMEFEFNTASGVGSGSGYKGGWRYANFFFLLEDMYPEAGAFTFNESEWTNVGKSQFFDGWFGGIGQEYSEDLVREVVTYRNNEDPNIFLLYKPFGPGSLAEEIGYTVTPDAEGYVILDVTYPECVLVRPNVLSGVSNPQLFGGSDVTVEVTSYEGIQYYFQEYTQEEIIEEAEMWGDDLSNMNEDGLICIYRGRFGYVPNLDEENYWITSQNDPTPIPMNPRIKLPAGSFGAVEGIIDDSNAPVKYYNLQGVEISNPEKGQLVIKKQGANSTKVIK